MQPDRIIPGTDYREAKRELVYAWKRGNEYLYIGSTSSGYGRFLNHNVLDIFDTVLDSDEIHVWYPDDIILFEQILIKKFQPKFNLIPQKEKGERTICINPHCKKEFIVTRRWQKYCSRKCSNVRS